MTTIYGIHAAELALESGTGLELTVREGKLNARQLALLELADRVGCPVNRGPVDAGEVTDQGVALKIKDPEFRSDKELAKLVAEPVSDDLYLVLDGVTDPRNFGACLRSAASFGVTGVIVPKDRSAPLNDAAIKAASGAASLIPVYRVVNLSRTLDVMKKAGVWIVGAVLEGSEPLDSIDLKGRIGLVMGAEGSGLRQKTREKCDFLARIPCPQPDLSLNVSVATGICLYEAIRQRK